MVLQDRGHVNLVHVTEHGHFPERGGLEILTRAAGGARIGTRPV